MTHALRQEADLVFDAADDGFHGDTFIHCRLKLHDGATAQLLSCAFVDCTFDPPVTDRRWQLVGCVVTNGTGAGSAQAAQPA